MKVLIGYEEFSKQFWTWIRIEFIFGPKRHTVSNQHWWFLNNSSLISCSFLVVFLFYQDNTNNGQSVLTFTKYSHHHATLTRWFNLDRLVPRMPPVWVLLVWSCGPAALKKPCKIAKHGATSLPPTMCKGPCGRGRALNDSYLHDLSCHRDFAETRSRAFCDQNKRLFTGICRMPGHSFVSHQFCNFHMLRS